ncbi:MAG: tetratricopeptide repeat protein [Enhydrobacter sp.]|nr:MAG: tetratricopeptide repeat protein [Enhydrobacter sp.]
MSDPAAFQEIEDAVRQDDLKIWWKRWGSWVIGGAVLVVVGVTALVGWRHYDANRRAAAGTAYSAALAMIGSDNAAARAVLDEQATNAPEPYRSLAALIAAQMRETPAEQVAALRELAPKLPSELADLALVIAGYRGVDAGKTEEMTGQLETLAAGDRPFRVSAREVQAIVATRKGETRRARELWQEIANDRAGPAGAQQRAQIMLAFLGPAEAK